MRALPRKFFIAMEAAVLLTIYPVDCINPWTGEIHQEHVPAIDVFAEMDEMPFEDEATPPPAETDDKHIDDDCAGTAA